MKELFFDTLKYLKSKDIYYGDIRYCHINEENIVVEKDYVSNISHRNGSGCAVRVLVDGSWGFASTSFLDKDELIETVDRAIRIARFSSCLRGDKKIDFKLRPAIKDTFKSTCRIDPFALPLKAKLDLLLSANHAILSHKNIQTATSGLEFYKTKKMFISTEGSDIEQELVESLGYSEILAVSGDEVQKRSYPSSYRSGITQAGYEYIEQLDLIAGAKKIKDEALMLLTAKECPSKKITIILEGSQLALQIHESCGHPVELDRVLGYEKSFAGGSFLTLDKLNNFRYGSKHVNIVNDATAVGGVGSFGYDDEGTRAVRSDIIKDGLFVGYLTSRETAAELNQESNGCMRAQDWNHPPLIRMTNINLLPGKPTLDELISDTKDGILLSTNKSWSIDDIRLNFQFGTEIAWEIKNGKVEQVLKNPIYTGITPEFWKSCTGVANKDSWRIWGVPNCGKGEPVQTMHVAHGASAARFENVQIGKNNE